MSESLDEALARQHQILTDIAHEVQRDGPLKERMAAVKAIMDKIARPPALTCGQPPDSAATGQERPFSYQIIGPPLPPPEQPSVLQAVNAVLQAAPERERAVWKNLAVKTWDVSAQMDAVIRGEEPDLDGIFDE